MLKQIVYILLLCSGTLMSQVSPMSLEFEAQPYGGKEELEQVIQTQLTLPKILLTSNFEEEIVSFFDLDSLGYATNIKFSKGINNVLRNELKRMFKFVKFKKTQSSQYIPEPYWYVFKLSTDKYNRYFKQKNKLNLKKLIADSSYAVYSRADKSPEFYKNGDEGLTEYILTEIEYPKVAKEKTIEGTVVLEFVIETNGYVTNIEVKQGVNGGCTEEAVRLIKESRWQPALVNNKLVRYRTNYPISFSLRNVSKDGTSTIGQ